ncbi:MAG: hypothetical protein FJ006_08130 [Chloroflexi bacterium]|nr:hypothetical protein [Chloroflexota bacterium]
MGINRSSQLGWLIAILTFPGIIIHEWAHKFFCDRANVPVYKTCYFRLGNPAGYVIHGPVNSYAKAFFIATAPFLTNTTIAVIVFFIAVIIPRGLIAYILYWLGISVAMHSSPSNQDADSLWQHSKRALKRNPLALFGFPIVGLIKLSSLLSRIWFDLLYAVALFLLVAFLVRGESFF